MNHNEYFDHRRRNKERHWLQREDFFGQPIWVTYVIYIALVAFLAFGYYYNAVLH